MARVGDENSEEFGAGLGANQGFVLSILLFIIVLEALSREFHTGYWQELLYAEVLLVGLNAFFTFNTT